MFFLFCNRDDVLMTYKRVVSFAVSCRAVRASRVDRCFLPPRVRLNAVHLRTQILEGRVIIVSRRLCACTPLSMNKRLRSESLVSDPEALKHRC